MLTQGKIQFIVAPEAEELSPIRKLLDKLEETEPALYGIAQQLSRHGLGVTQESPVFEEIFKTGLIYPLEADNRYKLHKPFEHEIQKKHEENAVNLFRSILELNRNDNLLAVKFTNYVTSQINSSKQSTLEYFERGTRTYWTDHVRIMETFFTPEEIAELKKLKLIFVRTNLYNGKNYLHLNKTVGQLIAGEIKVEKPEL